MAKAAGASPATVQQVWSARGLGAHLVGTFKLSNDKRFEEELVDVVGLYLDPPDNAVVLCMDGMSEIQARDRTQSTLPICDNYGTHDHDNVQTWLTEHSRFHLHFTDLGLMARHGGALVVRAHRQGGPPGVFPSVTALIAAIDDLAPEANNDNPEPFVWTATAEGILDEVSRGRVALRARHRHYTRTTAI